MSDYSELVERLENFSQHDRDPDFAAIFEAAEAIERLEQNYAVVGGRNKILREERDEAERELAEARAALQDAGEFIELWCARNSMPHESADTKADADSHGAYDLLRQIREALAAPAPEPCPHGCRGTGWIGAGNEWGDTAALPCPIHSKEPAPTSEAERPHICWTDSEPRCQICGKPMNKAAQQREASDD